MTADPDADAQLDLLAEEFVERTRGGEEPSISEYARRHPEHAGDIEEIFPLLAAMESAKADKPLAGTRIGPYDVLREIGRGGMGVVYEALQTDLGRRVALKILPVQATLDQRFLERFRLEAQAAAKLKHAHIVPVIGYGADGDVHYYSMQFIEGRGLDEVVRELQAREADGADTRGRDDYRRIARIGLQLADAMAHAHAQGVLHRDLKPTNVLLDADEHAWITDFGLCHATDAEGLTRTGDVVGTFRYMPPERFSGVSNARGDVYGIGVVLYELLARRPPYEGGDAAVLAARIPQEAPPPPRAADAGIPVELELIVRKAMAHDAAERYPTADALATDLRAFLANQPVSARAPTAGYLIRKVVARHRALAATVAVALLLLVASTVGYVLHLREKEHRARRGHYAATIAAVEAALRSRNLHGAGRMLDAAPRELRNWEWHYLRSRLEPDLRTFGPVSAGVQDVSVSTDGAWLGVATDTRLRVYDYATGTSRTELQTLAPIDSVAWSPQGDRVAVATHEALEIWSWPEAERIFVSEGGEHRIVHFARAGDEIVAALVDGSIVRYDANEPRVITRYDLPHRALSLACDDATETRRIVVGTADGHVSVLDHADGSVQWSRSVASHGIHAVQFLDAARVAWAVHGIVHVWDIDADAEVRTHGLGGHLGPFIRDPLDRRLVIANDAVVRVFDRESGAALHALSGDTIPHHAAMHPDGRRLVVGSTAGRLREWYLGEGGDPLRLTRHMDDVISVDAHPGGRYAASGGFGGVLRVWDLARGELVRARLEHHGYIQGVRFSADGRWLASIDSRGEVLLFETDTWNLHGRWKAHAAGGCALAFAGDGTIVSTGWEGDVCRWSVPDGRLVAKAAAGDGWQGERWFECHIAVSAGGRWVAHGMPGGSISIRRGSDLRPQRTLEAHVQEVTGLDFDPTRGRLVSVSSDQTLRLWDPASGDALGGHTERDPTLTWATGLNGVSFSRDGSRIATGSFSGIVRLWDVEDARAVAVLHEEYWVSEVCFGPEGRRLLTAHSDGTVKIWDAVPPRERLQDYEAAARLRDRARPVVTDLLARSAHVDAALHAVGDRDDLDADVREAVRRRLHALRASHEGLVARLWRDLAPPDGDAHKRQVALAMARGFWRATRHREEPDPRCDSLLALGYVRCGQPERALNVLERIGDANARRAPRLRAIDLAVASLSHSALEQADEAAARLQELDAWLEAHPDARTERVSAFRKEAAGA